MSADTALKQELTRAIRQFIFEQKKTFTFTALKNHLSSLILKCDSEKDLVDLIEAVQLSFTSNFQRLYPRHIFFKNAQFLISPTEEELSGGYLIPGHRFIPFLNPEVKPWETVLLEGNQQPIPTCWVRKRVKDLYVYHSLFSRSNPHNLFQLESASKESNQMVEILAFDMGKLYLKAKMKAGSGLILTVLDWIKGEYLVEPISKRKRQQMLKEGTGWIEQLEKGFLRSFEDLGFEYPVEEQIAYAYFYAGKKVLHSPPLHLGGFIESCSFIHFVDVGTEVRLWHSPNIPSEDLLASAGSDPNKNPSPVQDLLLEMGIPLTEGAIVAYIRDALYHGITSPELVLQRMFGHVSSYDSPRQKEAFENFFFNLWKRVKRSYNALTDQPVAEIRDIILQLIDKHINWIHSLNDRNIDPQQLPQQKFMHASKLIAFLQELLVVLNVKNAGVSNALQESFNILPQVDKTLKQLREDIEQEYWNHTSPAPPQRTKKTKKPISTTQTPT
ncbi:MAG: hypothetical protein SNJ78_13185, partial [Spirochaetales bacterium]